MSLQKIDPGTVELNTRETFFRAIHQGYAESDILYHSSKNDGHPTYRGRLGLTFVTNGFTDGVRLFRYVDQPFRPR